MKMSNKCEYFWGADPASTNYGIAVLDQDGKLVFSTTVNPTVLGMSGALDSLPLLDYPPKVIVIERYVAYAGMRAQGSEVTTMMIGATLDRTRASKQFLFRAIDWKTLLVKERFKSHGFNNPSAKLDKKFSKAMATHLTGVKFKTDHEADAACLAFIGLRFSEETPKD